MNHRVGAVLGVLVVAEKREGKRVVDRIRFREKEKVKKANQ